MITYRLRDDLHACVANGTVAFLDVRADRYFALPASSTETFIALSGGDAAQNTIALTHLIDAGLIVASPGQQVPLTCPSTHLVTRSAIDDATPAFAASRLVAAFASYRKTVRRMRDLPLASLIDVVRIRKSRLLPNPRLSANEVAATLLALQRFVPVHDRCLMWSLTTMAFTSTYRIPATLVFGVRMAPFQAHAWVQWEDLVLNDHVDNVRPFTPILVI